MLYSHQPKWINPIYRRGGGHISLKVGGTINIGGVSAPVIRTMVGPNLLDAIAGGAVFSNRAHSVFTISKTSVCTKPTVISSISTYGGFLSSCRIKEEVTCLRITPSPAHFRSFLDDAD